MVVPFAVATNRKDYWERFCHSIAQNDVQVEVVFAGPLGGERPPLPIAAHFIDVPDPNIGAAQCWEIAARRCTGDLLALPPDDVIYSAGCIDAVVKEANKLHDPYDMFTPLYVHNGSPQPDAMHMWSLPNLPLLPVCGFMYATAHYWLHGIDSRFRGVFWDADLYMSLCARGGRTTVLEGHTVEERNTAHTLHDRSCGADHEVLSSLWPAPFDKRSAERVGFSEEAAGAWRGYAI